MLINPQTVRAYGANQKPIRRFGFPNSSQVRLRDLYGFGVADLLEAGDAGGGALLGKGVEGLLAADPSADFRLITHSNPFRKTEHECAVFLVPFIESEGVTSFEPNMHARFGFLLSTTIMHYGSGGSAASDGRFVDNKGLKIFFRLLTEDQALFRGTAKLLNSFKNNFAAKRGRCIWSAPSFALTIYAPALRWRPCQLRLPPAR
jgi:hypothetical protein